MKITGILFWTHDNKISEKFYKKLGFVVKQSNDEVSVVGLGEIDITLVNMRDDDEFGKDSMAHEKGKGMYIYIKVEDVDRFYDKAKTLNITPTTEPRDWPWGNREFIIKDPDGYKLCFWQVSK